MFLKLRMVNGKSAGKSFVMWKSPFVVGRHTECDLRIQSPQVSLHHCALVTRGSEVWVRDLGSTNGTLVNGKYVTDEQKLLDGDRLQVGPAVMDVLERENPPAILGADDHDRYDTTIIALPALDGAAPKTDRIPNQQPGRPAAH
jgi:pSer/pThr/pTyr-binding forkhead associated (FHA) protein